MTPITTAAVTADGSGPSEKSPVKPIITILLAACAVGAVTVIAVVIVNKKRNE